MIEDLCSHILYYSPFATLLCSQQDEDFHMIFNTIVSGISWGWDENSELGVVLSPEDLGGLKEYLTCDFTAARYVVMLKIVSAV